MFKTLFIVCFSFFNLLAVVVPGDEIDAYKIEVNNLYEEYIVIEDQSTSEYVLNIVFGQIADTMTFGVYFNNIGDTAEKLIIKVDNRTLNINPNIDQVVNLKAFAVAGNTVSFALNDASTNEAIIAKEFSVLTYAQFKEITDYSILTGNNMGTASDITATTSISNVFKNFYIVAIVIITIMSIIMIIAKSRHKGLFDQELKEDEVAIYQEEIAKKKDEINLDISGVEYQNTSGGRRSPKAEEPTEVYKKALKYDVEDEGIALLDVDKHLQDKGFITDYKMVSEDEKNSIMMELMLLRDMKKISPEQYKKETIKLWRK